MVNTTYQLIINIFFQFFIKMKKYNWTLEKLPLFILDIII